MAKRSVPRSLNPTPNPKLTDHLKAGGSSAKPPTAGRTGGGVPQNRRSSGGRKR
jgi:hypothetical protein